MRISKWERASALAGLVAGALLVVAVIVQGGALPESDLSGEEIGAYFVDHDGRVMTAIFVRLLAGLCFLWFLGALRSALARAEGDTARLAAVVFGAGLIMLGFSGCASAMLAGVAYRADMGLDGSVAGMFLSATNMFYILSGTALAWMLIGSFFVIMRTALFPKWVGWLGLLIALENLIALPFSFGESMVLGSHFLVLIWVAIVSVLLFRHPGLADPAMPVEAGRSGAVDLGR